MLFNIDNEREDIQRGFWKDQDQIRENLDNQSHEQLPTAEFAYTSENKFKVSEVCRNLIKKGGGRNLLYKETLFWDFEELQDVADYLILECIIPDEWDEPFVNSEDLDIYGHCPQQDQYEIIVTLINSD